MQIFLDFFFFEHLSSDHHIFLLKTKLDPDLGLDITDSISEVLVFDNREWSLCKREGWLILFP